MQTKTVLERKSTKVKLLPPFSLLAVLPLNTAILTNGRPADILIGRVVSGGGTDVEIDITLTDTFSTRGSTSLRR